MLSWSILIIINTSAQLASSILCLDKETIMKTSLYLLSIYLSFKTSLYKMCYRSSHSFSLFFSLYLSFPILSLYSYLLSLYLSLSLSLSLSQHLPLSLTILTSNYVVLYLDTSLLWYLLSYNNCLLRNYSHRQYLMEH